MRLAAGADFPFVTLSPLPSPMKYLPLVATALALVCTVSVTAQDFSIKMTGGHAGLFKGRGRIAIPSYSINYIVAQKASASGGVSVKAKSTTILAGLDEATIKWVSLAPPLIRPALLSGQLDASTEIVVGRPALEAAAKQPVTVLPYSDVMRDLYGNAIGASTGLIEQNPGLVRRFRDASLRGMRWTLDNPDAAGRVMAKHNPTYRAEVAAAEVRQTVSYVRGSAPVLGHVDPARMARCIAVVQGIGLIRPGLTPDRVAAFNLVPTA